VCFIHCDLVIQIIYGRIKKFLELRHKFTVKMLCTELKLVILKVLPAHTYTLVLMVLLLLEAPLKVLFWYCCETCIYILIFFYRCKMIDNH
jgi:hypothetical protein